MYDRIVEVPISKVKMYFSSIVLFRFRVSRIVYEALSLSHASHDKLWLIFLLIFTQCGVGENTLHFTENFHFVLLCLTLNLNWIWMTSLTAIKWNHFETKRDLFSINLSIWQSIKFYCHFHGQSFSLCHCQFHKAKRFFFFSWLFTLRSFLEAKSIIKRKTGRYPLGPSSSWDVAGPAGLWAVQPVPTTYTVS